MSTRHARESELFLKAVEVSPEERANFLERACGSDVALRESVEMLLARDAFPAVLDRPPGTHLRELLERSLDSVGALPERIGQYKVVGLLGQGGMGTVFRAEQSHPARPVALKVLHATLATPELLRRFEFEASVLARLTSPGIAQIFEAGVLEDRGRRVPFFAMELVEGLPLTEYAKKRQLSVRQRLELLAAVCRIVAHAHQKGIIHRDLKPANILVDEQGAPRILDFGVARSIGELESTLQTRPGQIVGTLPYMSLEQLDGDPAQVDTRNDVYALGVVGFELLAGRLPWDLAGKSLLESIECLRRHQPPPLGTIDAAFRGDIETIVAKALQSDREQRYVSAPDVAADIERFLQNEPIAARPPTWTYQLRMFTRRNRALVGGAMAVVIALTLGLIATAWQAARATRSEARVLVTAGREIAARRAAEQAAEKAESIKEFLRSVLTLASDKQNRGVGFTMREALDEAAARVEPEFADLPEVRFELQETLGEAYMRLGLLAQARDLFRSALEGRRAGFPAGHRQLLRPAARLAQVLFHLGAYVECETLYAEAYSIAESEFGSESRMTATLQGSLALARARLGRTDDAVKLLEASVATGTADSAEGQIKRMIQLGDLRTLQLDWAGAEVAYREALRLREAAGAEQAHASKTFLLNRIARVLQSQGRFLEAIPTYRELLDRQIVAVGEAAPRVNVAKARLATCLLEVGDDSAARGFADAARSQLCSKGATSDVANLEACWVLGKLYSRLGDPVAAETTLRQGLTLAESLPSNRDVLTIARMLAELLIEGERPDEAEEILRRAIGSAERGALADHLTVAECRACWAECLRMQGRDADAESQFRAAYDVLAAEYGRDHPRVRRVFAQMGSSESPEGSPD